MNKDLLDGNRKETVTLIMTWTLTGEYRVAVHPHMTMARAIEEATRGLSGHYNVDPESVRFRIEE